MFDQGGELIWITYVTLILIIGLALAGRAKRGGQSCGLAKQAVKADELLPATDAPASAILAPRIADLGKVPENVAVWQKGHLDAAHEHYANDKVFMANDILCSLERALRLNGHASDAALVASIPWVKEARLRVEKANQFMNLTNSDAGWQRLRDSSGVQTWYRPESSGLHTFRVTGEVAVPLHNIIALWREADLMSTWFPMVKASKELAEISRFHKVASMQFYSQWPVASREVVVDARGIDAFERGMVMIMMHSVESHAKVNIPPPPSGVVRADIALGGVLLEPLTVDKCRMIILMNMDLKMSLPSKLLNFVSGVLFHLIPSQAEKMGKKVAADCQYSGIMAARPDVYQYIINNMATKFGTEVLRHAGITVQSAVQSAGRQLLRACAKSDWVPDKDQDDCVACQRKFSLTRRRHHCRVCAKLVCKDCSRTRVQLVGAGTKPQRVCTRCHSSHGSFSGASLVE